MKPPYAIGSVPSLSGHAIAYRWRSLPRVRRHRASKPQGSSERVLPWQITMDQSIFTSLSHTHFGMKWACYLPVNRKSTVISGNPYCSLFRKVICLLIYFILFFQLIAYTRWTLFTILPVVTEDHPISPRFTLYDFLSRCKFSNPTRQPMVEFYLLTFPSFLLRKKHKSYW